MSKGDLTNQHHKWEAFSILKWFQTLIKSLYYQCTSSRSKIASSRGLSDTIKQEVSIYNVRSMGDTALNMIIIFWLFPPSKLNKYVCVWLEWAFVWNNCGCFNKCMADCRMLPLKGEIEGGGSECKEKENVSPPVESSRGVVTIPSGIRKRMYFSLQSPAGQCMEVITGHCWLPGLLSLTCICTAEYTWLGCRGD